MNVAQRQAELAERPRASLDVILTPALLGERSLSADEIQSELDNNSQGILGYVPRLSGVLWLRAAERQNLESPTQEPPRRTRIEPPAGPDGSLTGETS